MNSSKSPPILLVSMVPQHHHPHQSAITNSSTTSRTGRYVHTTTHPVRHMRGSYNNGSSSSNHINNNNHSSSSGGGGQAASHFAYSNGTLRLVAPTSGSNHRFVEESSGRPIKFVTAAGVASANHHAYNHIPNAIQQYQQQQSNRVAANQSLAAATTPNKRTYATIPLTRTAHQQHGTSTSYAKETGSSYVAAATLGGSGSGAMPAKGQIYYNMPYASVRGQKLDFNDRNGFLHNVSYHLTTTTTTATAAHTPSGDPAASKRSWSDQAGPRGINGREWGQPTGRQQYALVSTSMTP